MSWSEASQLLCERAGAYRYQLTWSAWSGWEGSNGVRQPIGEERQPIGVANYFGTDGRRYTSPLVFKSRVSQATTTVRTDCVGCLA